MGAKQRHYKKTWEMYCPDTSCMGNMLSLDPQANASGRFCPHCGKPMRNRRYLQISSTKR